MDEHELDCELMKIVKQRDFCATNVDVRDENQAGINCMQNSS